MRSLPAWLWALLAGVAVLVAAFVPVGWQMLQPPPPAAAPSTELPPPWQITRGPQGELVAFGLRLPGSTLAEARRLWGEELQVAVIASRARPAALEAYVERWQGGGVGGRLVLATDAAPEAIVRWQQGVSRRERIDADAERWTLRGDDLEQALRIPVVGATFLPAAGIDGATLAARFGPPGERVAGADGVEHWLYPDRALAIAWDGQRRRAVVQAVAPAAFDQRLRAPLAAATASAAGPASGPTR